jgi:transposase
MPLDPVIVARIVALIQDGRGQRARIVGKSLCAVQNVYQRYEETGLITRRPGSGRKRVTTQRDDRFLVSTSLRNGTASFGGDK